MISSEICCREQCLRRGFGHRKAVAPTQEGRAGHGLLKSSFASKNAQQLTQNLDGNNNTVMRQIAQQLEHESLSYGVVDTLRICQDIRVERDPHSSSS